MNSEIEKVNSILRQKNIINLKTVKNIEVIMTQRYIYCLKYIELNDEKQKAICFASILNCEENIKALLNISDFNYQDNFGI